MTDKLLQVLDMTEEEQEGQLASQVYYPPKDEHDLRSWDNWWRETKADLAFRLRDEVEMEQWPQLAESYKTVRQHWCKTSWLWRKRKGYNKKHISSSLFWLFHSKPIHWIIATLIAKGLAKEKRRPL